MIDLRIDPVLPYFGPGDVIAMPTTGEVMRVTAVRREVVRRLGFGRPRRTHRRAWPRVRYTGYIDVVRGDAIP